jgi:hypothetical protein
MRHVVLAMLALLLPTTAPARTPGSSSQPATATAPTSRPAIPHDPPVFHRMKAGRPERDGWYPARSTGCGFRVSTPAAFNDITVSHVEPDGSRVATHMIAADFGNVIFTVTASSNSVLKLPPNAADTYLDMLTALGTARNKRPARLDGSDCTEVDIVRQGFITRHRVVQRDDVLYALKVEVRGREFRGADDRMAERFFDSFRFPSPEPDDNAPGRTASAATP